MNSDIFLELGLHYKEMEFEASRLLPIYSIFKSISRGSLQLVSDRGRHSLTETGHTPVPYKFLSTLSELSCDRLRHPHRKHLSALLDSNKREVSLRSICGQTEERRKKRDSHSKERSHVCFLPMSHLLER